MFLILTEVLSNQPLSFFQRGLAFPKVVYGLFLRNIYQAYAKHFIWRAGLISSTLNSK